MQVGFLLPDVYFPCKQTDTSDRLEKELSSENPYVLIRALGVLKNLRKDNEHLSQKLKELDNRKFLQGEEYVKKQVAYLINK